MRRKDEKRYRYLFPSGGDLFDAIYPPHASFDYPTRSCEVCKAYVAKAILERKEVEKREELKPNGFGLWDNVKKICPFTGPSKDQNSLVGKKTSRENLKREALETCRDENKRKEPSNKPSLAPSTIPFERKEAEKRPGLLSICYCLWKYVKKICSCTGPAKNQNTLVGKKTSRGNLKRETLKTCRDENKRKEPSNKPSLEPPTIHLSRDPAKVCVPRYDYNIPKTVPNKFPGEKSTQTKSELGMKGTQTEESFQVRSNEINKEVSATIEHLKEEFELVNEHVCPSDLENEYKQQLESSTEDQHSSTQG